MSDFLTRLAERTLGLAQVAQPVIAPMFAPVSGDYPPVSDYLPVIVQEESFYHRPPTAAVSETRSISSSSKPGMHKRSIRSISGAIPGTLPVPLQQVKSGSLERDDFKPVPEFVSPEHILDRKRPEEKISGSDERSVDIPEHDQNANDRNARLQHEYSPAAQSAMYEHRTIPEHRTILGHGTIPEPEIYSDRTAMESLEEHLEVPPAARPPDQVHSHMAVQKSSSAPTIKVTIGRIEIRAVAPPQMPIQRQRTPGPVLSLDNYLKQRNEGLR